MVLFNTNYHKLAINYSFIVRTMTKKAYMKPVMNVVMIRQQHIVCASLDDNKMNKSLQDEEVDEGWSRRQRNVWDEEEDE